MPRGGSHGRGKKTHKGGTRHFTTPAELEQQEEKMRKEKEWRKQKGYPSESEEEEEGEEGAAAAAALAARGAPGDLPPAGSESEGDSSEEEGETKAKGVEHLIEIENPNRIKQKVKKVTALGENATAAQLSRKEREEIEKQEAKQKYLALHAAGKTDEARADLARLALIRKQREEAAKKKEEERKAREEAAAKQKKS